MKIAVLASGGVDSSVVLKLLKDEGHEIEAFYLKIWLEDELSFLGNCPWKEDLKYIEEICKRENIKLNVIPFQKEYFDQIVSYTISEVKEGRTPNPDVLCNTRIKFGAFLNFIDSSFDKIATGHYADSEFKNGSYFLKRNSDPVKDQTYFLSNLKQEQLKKIIFPIGQKNKEEIRTLAKKYKLPNQERKDSQGLCFLGKIKFSEFLKAHLGIKKGKIIDTNTERVLGEHNGFWYYTIGQRHGLDLSGGPWYVVKKDTDKNIVFISNQKEYKEQSKDKFLVHKFNWIPNKPTTTNLLVKIRHGEHFYKAKINYKGEDLAEITLNEKDQGIAPGQFTVFYDDNYCLGSAVIKE